MTNTLRITKDMLDANNVYVGSEDVTNFQGSIEIAADLGRVRFMGSLCASL